ncbi:hypothetical protein [Kitasatospora sp. NPDC056531]
MVFSNGSGQQPEQPEPRVDERGGGISVWLTPAPEPQPQPES